MVWLPLMVKRTSAEIMQDRVGRELQHLFSEERPYVAALHMIETAKCIIGSVSTVNSAHNISRRLYRVMCGLAAAADNDEQWLNQNFGRYSPAEMCEYES